MSIVFPSANHPAAGRVGIALCCQSHAPGAPCLSSIYNCSLPFKPIGCETKVNGPTLQLFLNMNPETPSLTAPCTVVTIGSWVVAISFRPPPTLQRCDKKEFRWPLLGW
jgi:hypothetical protein